MLDLNAVRQDFARYLLEHASTRYSLDAALMHVVERAYEQGIEDALSVPAVLALPLPDLDAGMAAGMRGEMPAEDALVPAPSVSGEAAGAGAGGGVECGDAAVAPGALKGGPLAKLAGMWCNDAGFQAWLKPRARDLWDRFDAQAPDADCGHLVAGKVLRVMLGVKTRAELDHDDRAAEAFNRLVRVPYAEHLKGGV